MLTAQEALERLREGNRRFATDLRDAPHLSARRREVAMAQFPFAIVLGCSESRVPAEIIFDQGLGDLFVIRVAGNIVAPSQIGSVEFAAAAYGTKLVVVLGHTSCGAILTTIDELSRPVERQSRNLASIVNLVRPSIEVLMHTELAKDRETLVRLAVRANIGASVSHLRHSSEMIETLIARKELMVVGAEYSLETGLVEFFDRVPEPAVASQEM
jgi:carbonic anhydrase